MRTPSASARSSAAASAKDFAAASSASVEATTEPSQSLFPKIAKEFEAQNPNVTVKATALENEAFKSKMTALVASGDLPDIYVTWGGGVLKQQIDAGLVKDITSEGSEVLGTTLALLGLVGTAMTVFFLTGVVDYLGEGGTERAGMTTAFYLYRMAFDFNDFGAASAMSWLLIAVVALLTWATHKLLSRP